MPSNELSTADWRPDLRLADPPPDPLARFARQIEKDKRKVEKARKRAAEKPVRSQRNPAAICVAVVIYLGLCLGVVWGLADRQRTQRTQKAVVERTCMMLNRQRMEQKRNLLVAYHAAYDANMRTEAIRIQRLARAFHLSMSDCRH